METEREKEIFLVSAAMLKASVLWIIVNTCNCKYKCWDLCSRRKHWGYESMLVWKSSSCNFSIVSKERRGHKESTESLRTHTRTHTQYSPTCSRTNWCIHKQTYRHMGDLLGLAVSCCVPSMQWADHCKGISGLGQSRTLPPLCPGAWGVSLQFSSEILAAQ